MRGQEYISDRIAFGYEGSQNYDLQNELLEKLLAAKQVDVRHHPTKPELSVLTYGTPDSLRRWILYSTLGIIFCLGFYAMALSLLYSERVFPGQF